MTIKESILFKDKYMRRVRERPIHRKLTPYESEHKDHWANRVFGHVRFAYMFHVLIPNIKYAIEYGYEVASIDG